MRYTFLHQQHFLGLGKECVMIVQRGTLKKGCYLVGGTSFAKVNLGPLTQNNLTLCETADGV